MTRERRSPHLRPILVAACAVVVAVVQVLGIDSAAAGPAAAGCPTVGAAHLLLGDVLDCLTAGRPDAPGTPGEFTRVPGVVYAGAHGPEPQPLPLPPGCDTPVSGTWAQDFGMVNRVVQREGRVVYEVANAFHWLSGTGAGGRSSAIGEVWADRSGLIIYVSRELFEGTISGRTGSATVYNVANVAPSGDYTGQAFSLGGTEGLSGLRLNGLYRGRLGQGGRWSPGSRMCFAD